MERVDVAALVRVIEAMCPAQKIDAKTPDAWYPLLLEVSAQDALTAVRDLGRRQSFISPADVLEAVRALRADRLAGVDDVIAALGGFPGDPDDAAAEVRWRRSVIAAVADGRTPPPERAQAAALEAARTDQAAGAARVRAVIEGVHAEQRARAAARSAEQRGRREVEEVERARQLAALAAAAPAEPEPAPPPAPRPAPAEREGAQA